MLEERLRLRGEHELAAREPDVTKRLLAQPVADQHEALAPAVPERDREHALDPLGEPETPLLVGVRDERGVARARDVVPERLELAAELRVVVELAVEDRDDLAAFVGDRLVAGLQVDDRQTPVGEGAGARDGDGAVVGAPMYHRAVHARDQVGVGRVPA